MKTVNYMQPGPALQGYATVPATSDAKEYLRLLLRHKFGLLMTLLLGIGLAALYLISTTPVYEASSLVEVNERSGPLDDDDSGPDWTSPGIKEEVNILKSRKVLQPVVDLYDLRNHIEPKKVPVLGDVTARIPALAGWVGNLDFAKSFAWSDERLEISDFSVPREWEDSALTLTSLGDGKYSLSREDQLLVTEANVGEKLVVQLPPLADLTLQVNELSAENGVEFNVTRNSLEETISNFRASMSTETSDTKSRMITVKLRGDDARETAELTNEIVSQYRDIKLTYETIESSTEREILEQSLPQVEAELRAAEDALARFRVSRGSLDTNAQTRIKLNQLDVLERERTELEIEKADLEKRYTASHPDMKRIDKRLGVLNDQIRKVRGTISVQPRVERDLKVLEEEADTKRLLFREMSEKLQRIRIAEAGNVGSVQIWDQALTPKKPVSPNKLLALVGATLATLFLYMLYLTLRSALTTVISDQESLERASGLPVFMNIPKSSAQKRIAAAPVVDPRRLLPGSTDSAADPSASANVLALKKPEDYSVENLRGLRSMLEDVMSGARNNVLMITSPLPSMGKSFVSMNLSVLLAQAGKRVLLIDADYQRGQLHKNFGLQMGPGLPEVVRGKSELKETVKPTSVPNLYVIPRGFMGDGVAREMPSDQEFGAFMNVVAPRFDIAIIDTPPVLSVSTAATLGKHAGSTIMVVKEGEVKEPQLAESLKRLSFSGVQVNGCIMNGSSAPTPRHYAYYREQLDG
ncbi:MAG: AAA family ATPase [Gammaproteobacteria bacterium]|nr:AAA family ATPase [Gammaproteobacteria bacterium]